MSGTSNEALLRAISDDRALGSAMLFNHRHEYESPDFHVSIMDLWRCAHEFVLIEAFREAAKTTLAEEFLCMEGCYGNFFYTIIFGETYTKACQKIEAIAYEARTNFKLKKLFGRVLEKKPTENKIWFASGAMIEAAGWEQEITGFKHLDRRPDRAYLDDVENLERVRSTEAVNATMNKLYGEVLPALDKKRRKVRVTETPRGADCLVTRLRSNADWLCASFPICSPADPDDPRTVSLWPSRYPIEWIREERNRYERAGMLRQFQQEFLLNVDTTDTKPFSEEMIRSLDLSPAAWLPRYAIYDPARTADPQVSDRTGKVVVSRLGSKIIVHESGGYFWKPDQTRTDLFATWERHKCAEIGVEENALNEFLMQPIRFEMMRRGLVFPLKGLRAPQDRDKEAFIMGLQPFFAAGDVLLVGGRGNHAQLVAEMLNFPGGKLDILNALAYALRMFAGQPVYEDFVEANIGPAPALGPGEKLILCWNASVNEVVCAALLRQGRHFSVSQDWAVSGPVLDCVRSIVAKVRAAYPRSLAESYAPAELHDSWHRVPLVPVLRGARMTPWRGEHTAVSRGALAEKIRTTLRERRLFSVAKDAPLTLNALAAGYKFPVEQAGKAAREPEPGISRLIAEALETTVAMLDRALDNGADVGGHFATNPQGTRFRTALPNPRRT